MLQRGFIFITGLTKRPPLILLKFRFRTTLSTPHEHRATHWQSRQYFPLPHILLLSQLQSETEESLLVTWTSLHYYLLRTAFFGHPWLSLTPSAVFQIHFFTLELIFACTTGSKQQSFEERTHALKTPAVVNLKYAYFATLFCEALALKLV